MATLSTFRFLSGLVMISAATAFCVAPACTVSNGDGDEEGGAGGEGPGSTGGTSTGGTSTGGTSTGGAGGAGEGGAVSGEGGAPMGGAGGEAGSGGEAGGGGAGGAGGASGKVCTNPATGETTAKGDNCSDYCSAYLSTCAAYNVSDGTFSDLEECLNICELFDDAQLCCRAYHVSAASTDATVHCPHAAGNSLCN